MRALSNNKLPDMAKFMIMKKSYHVAKRRDSYPELKIVTEGRTFHKLHQCQSIKKVD